MLIIDIINANDHAPEFESMIGSATVEEEVPVGTLVMVVRAWDADRDLVTYEIISQSVPGALKIQSNTGKYNYGINPVLKMVHTG